MKWDGSSSYKPKIKLRKRLMLSGRRKKDGERTTLEIHSHTTITI
jgi:hypothetical protein